MSVDRIDLVLVDGERWRLECAGLSREADLAVRRQGKALTGDRREALRYDRLAEAIEQIVRRMAALGDAEVLAVQPEDIPRPRGSGHSWIQDPARLPVESRQAERHLAQGGTVVVLCDPFATGEPGPFEGPGRPVPPGEMQRVTDAAGRLLRGGRARRALWEQQLAAARERDDAVVVPSAISNAILTEGLRRFAGADGLPPTAARVIYRDGSEGPRFPLGAVVLGAHIPPEWPVLRFVMMSMRHNNIDPEVDGVWFRNRLLSRSLTEGQTDQLAFDLSVRRLDELLAAGPLVIEFHQTGLQPAVMGFYRAVLTVLAQRPASLVVCPLLHGASGSGSTKAAVWGQAA